jgi:excisionase family DNA binding protein
MNLREASAFLGTSVWTLRGFIKRRRLRYARMGKYFIVSKADLVSLWHELATYAVPRTNL